jgi:2-oxoglutarate dehydrogenase E1 component
VDICLQKQIRYEIEELSPTLDIENFGLSSADLGSFFDAARVIGIAPCSLSEIIKHLDSIYCQHIGIEYMYIRKPEIVQWIKTN